MKGVVKAGKHRLRMAMSTNCVPNRLDVGFEQGETTMTPSSTASTADAIPTLTDAGPQTSANRLHILDALRGFALLGIFVANIQFFSGWGFLSPDQQAALAPGYVGIFDALNIALIDGKFYTLFSLLFGIGFALQLSRLEAAGSGGVAIYVRRLLILLVIGIIHLSQLWSGDILTPYALLGFLLLAVRKWSDANILRLAAFFFICPFIGHLVFWAMGASPDLGFYGIGMKMLSSGLPNFQGDFLSIFRGGWQEFFAFNQSGAFIRIGYLLESWRMFKLAFVMLVGLWVGRHIVADTFFNNVALLKRVAIIGFGIGLPMSFVYAKLGIITAFAGAPDMAGLWRLGAYMFSVFPLGFAYGAAFALLWRKHEALLQFFAPAGRMALTNYLMQTIIGIAIFYGIGLGLVGTVSPIGFVAIAIGVYLAQIIFSKLWLSRFKYGPMEWVWRSATYGKVLALGKAL